MAMRKSRLSHNKHLRLIEHFVAGAMPEIKIQEALYHVNSNVYKVAKTLFAREGMQTHLDELGEEGKAKGLIGVDLLDFVISEIIALAEANPKKAWQLDRF